MRGGGVDVATEPAAGLAAVGVAREIAGALGPVEAGGDGVEPKT
jgi:hypothetical protein